MVLSYMYEREIPPDPSVWHRWNTILRPVRTISGAWTLGIVWRRRRNGPWEYQRREETEGDWD